ncbi:hypothetical protein [Acuticoccus sp. I52.16.1]|uniref:hypothetical protein n=1 Tax=Acuticoccus sp. I52.16.1 TaxID=2928472 RepID=UPI001FD03ADD|nr:hypothetical protein [Acuticoccus sp. I52.16.1]UOM32583.1 hypothetical protein MRB58_11870 [Acuticoccus sp. I52.16.1]
MSDVVRILVAPLVWLASFSAVYGLHGLLCGHGLAEPAADPLSLPRALLVGAYGVALALQVAILVALHRPGLASSSHVIRCISVATGWVGLVAAAWTLMPVLTTSLCR